MEEGRLRLKSRTKQEKIKKAIADISDKRFKPLQKKLIKDLDKACFLSIDLELYMRLGGWSHTGGSYCGTMVKVQAFCKILFGYELPEKIGKIHLKDQRYRSLTALAKIAPVVKAFHEEKIKA